MGDGKIKVGDQFQTIESPMAVPHVRSAVIVKNIQEKAPDSLTLCIPVINKEVPEIPVIVRTETYVRSSLLPEDLRHRLLAAGGKPKVEKIPLHQDSAFLKILADMDLHPDVFKPMNQPTPAVKELVSADLAAFFHEFFTRKDQDHDLFSLDDPYRRVIGFMDTTDNTHVILSLSQLKNGLRNIPPVVCDRLGLMPADIKISLAEAEGREIIFGKDEFKLGGGRGEVSFMDLPSNFWVIMEPNPEEQDVPDLSPQFPRD